VAPTRSGSSPEGPSSPAIGRPTPAALPLGRYRSLVGLPQDGPDVGVSRTPSSLKVRRRPSRTPRCWPAASPTAGGDPIAALQRYEALRRPRATQIQQLSHGRSLTNHFPGGPQQRQRDLLFASADPLVANGWIYGYDPDIELARSMRSPRNPGSEHPH
jgi:hypothetical protein